MARIGFIGLGNIGGAIARNLLEDGHDVAVHDVDKARVDALVKDGAEAAANAAEVASRGAFENVLSIKVIARNDTT